MPAGNISFVRFNAVGEQETQDWLQALDAVNNRIDTLERKVTSHTASMSQAAMDLNAVSKRVDNCTTDITAYKRYIENRFKNNEEVCQREFLDLRSMANTTQQCLESLLPRRLNAIEEQIGLLGQQTAELLSILANTDTGSRARSYNISTPVDRGQPRDAAQVEVPDTPRTDQHPRPSAGLFGERYDSRFGEQRKDEGHGHPQPAGQPQSHGPSFGGDEGADEHSRTAASSNEARPQDFGNDEAFTGPQVRFSETHQRDSPAARPEPRAPKMPSSFNGRHDEPQSPPVDAQGRWNPNGAGRSPFGDNAYLERMSPKDFDISYKHNPQLQIFNESIEGYAYWASRAADHIARQNYRWMEILEYSKNWKSGRITKHDLIRTHCDGVNAWTIATKLESWLSDWMGKGLYNRKNQLAGGKTEAGNGLEIWRQLFIQYSGGTEAVRTGGQLRLKDWPKCTSMSKLEQHLDDWKNCLDEYGSELYSAPTMLRSMLLGILPDELEQEANERPELVNHELIIEWVKRRLVYKRTKLLAQHARKGTGSIVNMIKTEDDEGAQPWPEDVPRPEDGSQRVSRRQRSERPLSRPEPEAPPTWLPDLIHAIRNENGNNSGGGGGGRRDVRKPKADKARFYWAPDRCWHCGGVHKRETCTPWVKIMKDHNGNKPRAEWKSPPDYVSAKAKAYKKWRLENPKPAKKGRINSLEDTDDESDSDFSEDGFHVNALMPRNVACALRSISRGPRTPTAQVLGIPDEMLQALDDEDCEPDMVANFGTWASKVTVGKQNQKTKRSNINVIATEHDLRKFLEANPGTALLPLEPKKLTKVMKLMTSKIQLEDDEELVLMDSGSTINVAKIHKHFKQYANFVVPSKGSKTGETATTASGHKIKNRGKCMIHGVMDGHDISAPFQDMDVELPILSVQKCVRAGNDVSFTEDGGEMRNRRTGKVIQIHQVDGVYFVKMKVKPPPTDQARAEDFHRPGR